LRKRYGTIGEQAAAILLFASDEASYITGVTLPSRAVTWADAIINTGENLND